MMEAHQHVKYFFDQLVMMLGRTPLSIIEDMARELSLLQGRLFLLGVGGSAANCSHAVNDFRKLCNIEAYAPTDNVAELTARTNDEGWDTVFSEWLKTSRINNRDAIFIMSVGGGTATVSANLVKAIDVAKACGAKVFGIVGREGSYTARYGDLVIIPDIATDTWLQTPLVESFQALVWHCLVSHPLLQKRLTKW